MSAKTLAELALKVWGVILLLGALSSIPAALLMAWTAPSGDPQAAFLRASQTAYLISVIVPALAGIVVLVWADRIVAWFEADDTPLQIEMSSTQAQVLAFSIVGVFVLVDGLQNLASAGYWLLTRPDQIDSGSYLSYLSTPQGEGIVRGVVQTAAGALLVFGRQAIGKGWSRLRGQGASDAGDTDDAG